MALTRRRFLPLLAASTLALVAAACGSDDDSADDTAAAAPTTTGAASATTATGAEGGEELPAAELALVAYSTPQEAYEKIIAAFQATPQGKNITFTQSYG